jgi:large subunit ribosomal protein L35
MQGRFCLALGLQPFYVTRSIKPHDRPKWHAESRDNHSNEEMEMPKMKTKSAAKKRFRFTASGKVKAGPAGKRHGMIKRTTKFIRDTAGTMILCDADAKIVKKYMPYNR